ncbi:DUF4177 domain-containing protein [Clostridium sp. MT-14]|jgi:hypothetical protein|uniref:DUF4177 domain-containing protein n=1 Tax=Clostridium aromativorans TaxID=2836848 RepID=A0ABS8N681_9CLOT|nr:MULTISPECIES: DUF4177 domain-containing protein [Clostridium]KAA8680574.1 DUF4177 domain-containing protein [Clostridium sp. HV4-5-A1G]MCC9295297.1 DUF4177 domain-containing protein [Clostridium aromativorans]CAB1261750.1 conserved hypothetical protein [Clostridiaceae bacterium BL-3]
MVWEYKVFTAENFLGSDDDLTLEEKLNKFGKDNWEFSGIIQKPYTTLGKDSKVDGDCIIFKRRIEN